MKRYLHFILLALVSLLSGACSDTNKPVAEGEHFIDVKGESIFNVKYEGEIISVQIDANCDWSISKTNEKGDAISWIKTDTSSGKGSKVFNIKVLPNNTQKERSGIVNIYSDRVTEYIDIIQAANPNPEPEPTPDPEPEPEPEPEPDPEPEPENPTPENPEDAIPLVLTFDFTNVDAMAGWPKNITPSEDPTARFTCPYVIDNVTYNFISSQPLEVTSTQWPYFSETELAVVIPKQRCLGFPIVEGRVLTQVVFTVNATAATYAVSNEVGVGSGAVTPVTGGDGQKVEDATEFTFNLTGTEAGTQYWLKVSGKAPRMTSMTLTYSK